MDSLRLLSLSCHGYNLGNQAYLSRVSNNYDIILLQETWLSDCASSKTFSRIIIWFIIALQSAMQDKIMSGIMTGRPFGGTAVLVRRQLGALCYQVPTDNPRVTCVCVPNQHGPNLIICSVYMPWSDRSLEHVTEYEACLGCMQGVVDRHRGAQFLFGGDFNVPKHSSNICSLHVKQFVECNDMLWLDVRDGECDYTYHSDANSHYSLLDYFIVSPPLVDECKSANVLNDGDNQSDHLAISCKVDVAREMSEPNGIYTSTLNNIKLNWNNADKSA